MKKILALVLALCMVFALCACGSSSGDSDTPAASPVSLNVGTGGESGTYYGYTGILIAFLGFGLGKQAIDVALLGLGPAALAVGLAGEGDADRRAVEALQFDLDGKADGLASQGLEDSEGFGFLGHEGFFRGGGGVPVPTPAAPRKGEPGWVGAREGCAAPIRARRSGCCGCGR